MSRFQFFAAFMAALVAFTRRLSGWEKVDYGPIDQDLWTKVIAVEDRHWYEIRTVLYRDFGAPVEGRTFEFTIEKGYDKTSGLYLGDPHVAEFLHEYSDGGIVQLQPGHDGGTVACSGFCPNTGRWAGWSHRAIASFGGGDMVFEEDFGDDMTMPRQHGRRPIKTFEDARESAMAYARSVS